LHVAIPLLLMCVGFVATAVLNESWPAHFALALVPIGMAAAVGPFFAMPTLFLAGEAAAGGIALVVSIGIVGGFVGPALVGVLKGDTGSYSLGFKLLGGTLGAAALLTLPLRRVRTFAPARQRPNNESSL
jgi:ACS family tartrate transporter-like MFS transporter